MTINDFDLATFVAYRRLLDMSAGIVDKKKFYEAAKEFVDAYESEKHEQQHKLQENLPESEKPEAGEIYRDIFGNKYLVITVNDSFSDGTPIENPRVVLARIDSKNSYALTDAYMPTLEEFLNPAFVKE